MLAGPVPAAARALGVAVDEAGHQDAAQRVHCRVDDVANLLLRRMVRYQLRNHGDQRAVHDRFYSLDLSGQHWIGTACNPKLEGCSESRALVRLPQEVQHRRRRVGAGLDAAELANRGLGPLLSEVLDGRDHQIFLRPEVVDLRATGDAGELGYSRRGGSRVAVSHQALDGGVEQPGPHGSCALRLGAPDTLSVDFRRHSDRTHLSESNSTCGRSVPFTSREEKIRYARNAMLPHQTRS